MGEPASVGAPAQTKGRVSRVPKALLQSQASLDGTPGSLLVWESHHEADRVHLDNTEVISLVLCIPSDQSVLGYCLPLVVFQLGTLSPSVTNVRLGTGFSGTCLLPAASLQFALTVVLGPLKATVQGCRALSACDQVLLVCDYLGF